MYSISVIQVRLKLQYQKVKVQKFGNTFLCPNIFAGTVYWNIKYKKKKNDPIAY